MMNGVLVRFFVCVPLPGQVKKKLEKTVVAYRRKYPWMKWVPGEQYHVTVKFCGEQSPDVFEHFTALVESVVLSNRPEKARLQIGMPGAFPDLSRARTFFIEIVGETGKLEKIASLMELAAAESGIARETRFFHPHVTLARSRRPERLDPNLYRGDSAAEWTADSILLVKSELGPSGPEYSTLKEWSLF